MTTTAIPGPSTSVGINPPITGPTPGVPNAPPPTIVPENPDAAPNLSWMGAGIRDIRYLAHIGAGANVAGYKNQDCGFLISGPGIFVVDQVPSAIATANIAALANVVNGTPMVLAAGTGITALTTPFTVLPTGLVVPTGAMAIDGNPAWQGAGQSGAFAFMDPTKALARVASISGVSGGAGGAFKLVGADLYGNIIHETVTVAAGANTVNSAKTYKWLISVTPQFTDAHNYSVGTGDVFGLPLFAPQWPGLMIYWGTPPATQISSPTGFTAGVTTAATATSGDIRGSYAAQASASDGTKKLSLWQPVPFAAATANSFATASANLFGVAQFAS